eukprot:GDKJ01012729.1.p1 GENE.GDKJ01012729.1~~GDKJ01012729.1.p1  ORF type:complete len:2235 (-),score=577.10 GDKJ01012729.1:143-6847(-)
MSLAKKSYCEYCRDLTPDVTCSNKDCKRQFHKECVFGGSKPDVDLKTWLCDKCSDNEQNDVECYLCHKEEGQTEHDLLLCCDGCVNSAHMACMGLVEEPLGETWFCLKCKPITRITKNVGAEGNQGVNDTFCFVCQEGGKLMYCETCPKSFHGKCIDVGDINPDVQWSCPCCQGFDPTDKGVQVLTRQERKTHLANLQKVVRAQNRTATRNKTAFLWENRELIAPFVTPQQLLKLKKEAEKIGVIKRSAASAKLERAAQGRVGKMLQNSKNKKRRDGLGSSSATMSSASSAASSSSVYSSDSESDTSNDETDSTSSTSEDSSDESGIRPSRRRSSMSRQEEAKKRREARFRALASSSESGGETQKRKKSNPSASNNNNINKRQRRLLKSSEDEDVVNDALDLDFSEFDAPSDWQKKTVNKMRVDTDDEDVVMNEPQKRSNRRLLSDDEEDEVQQANNQQEKHKKDVKIEVDSEKQPENDQASSENIKKNQKKQVSDNNTAHFIAKEKDDNSNRLESANNAAEAIIKEEVKISTDGNSLVNIKMEEIPLTLPSLSDPVSLTLQPNTAPINEVALQQPVGLQVDVSKNYAKAARVGDKEVPCRWRAGLKAMKNGEIKAAKDEKTGKKIVRVLAEGIKLKAYQELGVDWLIDSFFNKSGAILADEMGLGKTIQTLAFLSYLKVVEGITGPYLVVVPLSTVGNWMREAKRFVPHLRIAKICGSASERDFQLLNADNIYGYPDIYITTYETLKTEEKFFADDHIWQVCVLDEAHRIKNEKGSIRHSLDRVRCNMRLLLTGTPLQNSLKELFTLINFLFPGIMDGSTAFEEAFVENSQQKAALQRARNNVSTSAAVKKQIAEAEADIEVRRLMEADRLDSTIATKTVSLLSKLMMRRTKELVVALPTKTIHDVWLPLAPRSLSWYKRLLDLATSDMALKALLNLMTSLRLFCLHPRSNSARATSTERFELMMRENLPEGPQTDALVEEVVKQAVGDRALVGRPHMEGSSKLIFLDKLLRQLHTQSYEKCGAYRRSWKSHKELRNSVRVDLIIKTLEDVAQPESRTREDDNKFFSSSRVIASRKMKEGDAALRAILTEYKNAVKAEEEIRDSKVNLSKPKKKKGEEGVVANEKTEEEERLEKEKKLEEAKKEAKDRVRVAFNVVLKALNLSEFALEDAENDLHYVDDNLFAETILPFTFNYSEQKEKKGVLTEIEGKLVEAQVPEDDDGDDDDYEDESQNNTKKNEEISEKKEDSSQLKTNLTTVSSPQKKKSEANGSSHVLPHKILVFSQFQLVLDELERYLKWRGFSYSRLDGSTNRIIRELDIRDFNRAEDNTLVYLISTRAGGLGINLVSANHVVLFDEDWNPFVDLQAIDRAHRIGQKRAVNVFKLITEWTVEERMAFRRDQKLKLDKRIVTTHNVGCEKGETKPTNIDAGEEEEELGAKDAENSVLSPDEIRRLLTHGASVILAQSDKDAQERLIKLKTLGDHLRREHLALPDEKDILKQVEMDVEEESHTTIGVFIKNEDEEDLKKDDVRGATVNEEEVLAVGSKAADENDLSSGMRIQKRERKRNTTFDHLYHIEEKKEASSWRDKKCLSNCLMCDERIKTFDLDSVTAEKSGEGAVGVRCSKCPQVYHGTCLQKAGVTYTKSRSVSCPCHVCASCGRSASIAGGHLLHCLDCPEALCYDCFPDDHKRVLPQDGFFDMMKRMGWLQYASPDRYVTYRCNACRAQVELKRRRDLKDEERLAEIRAQEEARRKQKAKQATKAIKSSANAQENAGSANLLDFFAKKKVDTLETETSDVEMDGFNVANTILTSPIERVTLSTKEARAARLEEIIEASKMLKAEVPNSLPSTLVHFLKQKILDQKANAKKAKEQSKAPEVGVEGTETPSALDAPSTTKRSAAAKSSDWVTSAPDAWLPCCPQCYLPGHNGKNCPINHTTMTKVMTSEDGATSAGKRVTCCSGCGEVGHCKFVCDKISAEDKENMAHLMDVIFECMREFASILVSDIDFHSQLDPESNSSIKGIMPPNSSVGSDWMISDFEAFKTNIVTTLNNAVNKIVFAAVSNSLSSTVFSASNLKSLLPVGDAAALKKANSMSKQTTLGALSGGKTEISAATLSSHLTENLKKKTEGNVPHKEDAADLSLYKQDGTAYKLEELIEKIDNQPQFMIAQSMLQTYESRISGTFALPDTISQENGVDPNEMISKGFSFIFTCPGAIQAVRGLGKSGSSKNDPVSHENAK